MLKHLCTHNAEILLNRADL